MIISCLSTPFTNKVVFVELLFKSSTHGCGVLLNISILHYTTAEPIFSTTALLRTS